MNWLNVPVSALSVILCGALGLPLAADPFSSDYAGNWTGQGTIVTKFDGSARAGRCKIEVLNTNDLNEMRMEGFCAVAVGRSALVLRVLRVSETRLQAGFRAQGMDETAQFGGNYDNRNMAFQTKSTFAQGGQKFNARVAINFRDDNQFTLSEWMQPENGSAPERHVVSMTFNRQGSGN